MIKYTRSIEILSALVKDVFNTAGLSMDTKAIVLVLAATMSPKKYYAFIAPIAELAPISAKLAKVSDLRAVYGADFRDLIVLQVLEYLDRDICSDELQRYINANGPGMFESDPQEIVAALNINCLHNNINAATTTTVNPHHITATIQKAMDYLIEKLPLECHDQISTIVGTYLHCRSTAEPSLAYHALVYAISDILIASGLDAKNSLLYSYRIVKHALQQFLHEPGQNAILHGYNKAIDTD